MPAARRAKTSGAKTSGAIRPDTQLSLALGPSDEQVVPSGLPEMTGAEQVRAELDVLGLDASRHVIDFYTPLLRALEVVRSHRLLSCRSRSEVLVAGVKVATPRSNASNRPRWTPSGASTY